MGCGQRLGHVTELQMSVDKAPIEIILPSTSPTQYHTGTQSKTDLSKATSLGCYTPVLKACQCVLMRCGLSAKVIFAGL